MQRHNNNEQKKPHPVRINKESGVFHYRRLNLGRVLSPVLTVFP